MMNIPAGRSHGSQSDSIMCYMLSARRAYYRPLAVAESLRQNQDVSWRRAESYIALTSLLFSPKTNSPTLYAKLPPTCSKG